MRHSRGTRDGFTLLEVVVALAIGGVAIMLAATMLEVSGAQVTTIRVAAEASDARGIDERRLRRLVGQMRWGRGTGTPFDGSTGTVRFATACDSDGGWQEPCSVILEVATDSAAGIIASISTGEVVRLLQGEHVRGFLFVGNAGLGARWVDAWADPASLPSALGLVLEHDTLVVRVGERG